MSLFELNFSLTSVVLGLALTHMATAFRRLLLAGRRVKWAPEPIFLAAILLLVITFNWLDQWSDRGETKVHVGLVVLQVLKLLALYFAASSCLPEFDGANADISMLRFYDETRKLTFGALVVSLSLFIVSDVTRDAFQWTREAQIRIYMELLWISLYLTLMFVHRRSVNLIVLLLVLGLFGTVIFYSALSGPEPLHAPIATQQ